jgi:hypothetical protein
VQSPIAFISPFHGPSFFALDEMHLLGHGLSKHLVALFSPFNKNNFVPSKARKSIYPFYVPDKTLVKAGQQMRLSRRTIPTDHFSGNWDDIIARPGRAVDWLDFLLYIVPTLVIPRISDAPAGRIAKEKLNNLMIACHLCLQHEITKDEISFVKR